MEEKRIIFAALPQIHRNLTYSQTKGYSTVIIIHVSGDPHLTVRSSNLVYTGKSEYLYNGVCLYSQAATWIRLFTFVDGGTRGDISQ